MKIKYLLVNYQLFNAQWQKDKVVIAILNSHTWAKNELNTQFSTLLSVNQFQESVSLSILSDLSLFEIFYEIYQCLVAGQGQ